MLPCNGGDRILWFEPKGCRLKLWVTPNCNKEIEWFLCERGLLLCIISFHMYNKEGKGRLWPLGTRLVGNTPKDSLLRRRGCSNFITQKKEVFVVAHQNKSCFKDRCIRCWDLEPGRLLWVCRGVAWAVCDESRMHGSEGGKVWNDLPIPIGSATKWNKQA